MQQFKVERIGLEPMTPFRKPQDNVKMMCSKFMKSLPDDNLKQLSSKLLDF